MLRVFFMTVFCCTLYGCVTPDLVCWEGKAQSRLLYAKNTLDYSVMMQCFYCPLSDTNSDTLWCEREPVAWSQPININPNERKQIMDYVSPVYIRIYRSADTALLFETRDLRTYPLNTFSNGAMSYSDAEASKLGEFGSRIGSKSECIYPEAYYMKNSRYLLENIPWDTYPIWFDQNACNKPDISDWASRKTRYAYEANGYAIVLCIVFDKTKPPFSDGNIK